MFSPSPVLTAVNFDLRYAWEPLKLQAGSFDSSLGWLCFTSAARASKGRFDVIAMLTLVQFWMATMQLCGSSSITPVSYCYTHFLTSRQKGSSQ